MCCNKVLAVYYIDYTHLGKIFQTYYNLFDEEQINMLLFNPAGVNKLFIINEISINQRCLPVS